MEGANYARMSLQQFDLAYSTRQTGAPYDVGDIIEFGPGQLYVCTRAIIGLQREDPRLASFSRLGSREEFPFPAPLRQGGPLLPVLYGRKT